MPHKKEYRSAIRSRRMIRQAFWELLRERPFDKITVTDIVTRADINRSTFYAHYDDIYHLANSITDEILEKTAKSINNLDIAMLFSDPKPFLYEIFQIGQEHIDLYKLRETSNMALKQVERIKEILVNKAVTYMSLPTNLTQSNMFLIQSNFFVGGIINIYHLWATGRLVCSIDEIVEQIATLITNNAHNYGSTTQETR